MTIGIPIDVRMMLPAGRPSMSLWAINPQLLWSFSPSLSRNIFRNSKRLFRLNSASRISPKHSGLSPGTHTWCGAKDPWDSSTASSRSFPRLWLSCSTSVFLVSRRAHTSWLNMSSGRSWLILSSGDRGRNLLDKEALWENCGKVDAGASELLSSLSESSGPVPKFLRAQRNGLLWTTLFLSKHMTQALVNLRVMNERPKCSETVMVFRSTENDLKDEDDTLTVWFSPHSEQKHQTKQLLERFYTDQNRHIGRNRHNMHYIIHYKFPLFNNLC